MAPLSSLCYFHRAVNRSCARHKLGYVKMKKTIIGLMLMLVTAFSVNAQQKTAAELKAEREQIAAELKSKDVVKRQDKLVKLNDKAANVKQTGLGSIDGLAETSTSVLKTVMSTNEVLKQYRVEMTDNGNGEVEIAKYAANLDDYVKLAGDLAQAAVLAADGAKKLESAKDDVKKLSPLQAKPALSSISFSTDALSLSADEIALQTRIATNLIESIKASKNL